MVLGAAPRKAAQPAPQMSTDDRERQDVEPLPEIERTKARYAELAQKILDGSATAEETDEAEKLGELNQLKKETMLNSRE